MADYAWIEMIVSGKDEKKTKEFLDIIMAKNTNNIIGRCVGNAEIVEEEETDLFRYKISGEVKWNIHSSLINAAEEFKKAPWAYKLEGVRVYTLLEAAKEYEVDVECYSEAQDEQEHLLIKRGVLVKEESVPYRHINFSGEYNSKEEAEDDLGFSISDEQFENEVLDIGGFPKWDYEI